jgi:glucosamine-6-phosphate deaminase
MRTHLFNEINIPDNRIHIPDGLAPDIPSYCRYYEASIRSAGGIDIQILGIGKNGHLGFNEPSSSLTSRMRIKTLTDETRKEIAPGFGGMDKAPSHVLTLGLGSIMDSRTCLLLAFGKKKARAIAQTVEGPVTAAMPGSVLQMHPRAVVIVDEEAASELKMADYYRWVSENKPDWQKY